MNMGSQSKESDCLTICLCPVNIKSNCSYYVSIGIIDYEFAIIIF